MAVQTDALKGLDKLPKQSEMSNPVYSLKAAEMSVEE